ncbi:MAG: hypothetical protein RL514_3159 [Verrucomicrobiota bacterium]
MSLNLWFFAASPSPSLPPILFALGSDLAGWGLAAVVLWLLWRQRNAPPPSSPAPRPPAPDPFSAQHITRTFVAALPNLTRELNLEVATARQVEFFERTDQKSTLWGLIDLGTNTAQLRLPVTYRYHLRLADVWRLEVQGSHLIVHAPLLRASLPPAIHTDEMEAHTERGWCRCAPEDLLRELHREVTPLISQWAGNEQHLGLVRETARLQVAEFMRRWLEGETRWGPRSFTAISVRLGGEALPPPQPTRSLFLTPD